MSNQYQDVDPTHNHCSGWRYPDNCPCGGVFDEMRKECRDCYKDAQNEMWVSK